MNEITQRIYDRIVRDLNTLGCDFIVVTPEGHMDSQGSLQLQTDEVAPKIVTKTVEVPAATPQFFYDMMAAAADVMAFVCNGSSNQDFVRRKAAAWLQANKDYFVGPGPAPHSEVPAPRAKLVAPGTTLPIRHGNGRKPKHADIPPIDWKAEGVNYRDIKGMAIGDVMRFPIPTQATISRVRSLVPGEAWRVFGKSAAITSITGDRRSIELLRVK